MSVGIYGDIRVSQAVAAGAAQKVHHFLVSDSNTIKDGHGWDHGLQYALSLRLPTFATGFASAYSGYPAGYKWSGSATAVGDATGAPAEWEDYGEDASQLLGGRMRYADLASGETRAASPLGGGVSVAADWSGDVNANLQWKGWWGSFDSGTGSFRPRARIGESPYSFLYEAPGAISTNTGDFALQTSTLDIPAADRNYNIEVGFCCPGGTAITGPFFGLFSRVENTDRTAGVAFTTLCANSGLSARYHAIALQSQSDEFYATLFGAARQDALDAGDPPKIVIWLNSGLNDRNETDPSVGPAAVADGDSPEAFADNNLAMIQKLQSVWTDNGWSLEELNFIVMPSHRVSDPDDSELISYRAAAKSLAESESRVLALDISGYYTAAEYLSEGWYQSSGSDTAHLEQVGFETVAADAVDAVLEHAGAGLSSLAVAQITENLLDRILSGNHDTSGTVGKQLQALPDAAAAESGGLPTVDDNNRVAGVSGDVLGNVGGIAGDTNTLDDLKTAQDAQHAATQGAISDVSDEVATVDLTAAAIKAVTDNLPDSGALTSIAADAETAATGGADNPGLMLSTTIASVTSQTVLVLTAGKTNADAFNGCTALLANAAGTAIDRVPISDYTVSGTTYTVYLERAATFTVAEDDTIKVLANGHTQDTRDLSTPTVKLVWAKRSDGNVYSPTKIRIAPGESVIAGWMIPGGVELSSMSQPTGVSGDLSAAKLGYGNDYANVLLTLAAEAATGDSQWVAVDATTTAGGTVTLSAEVTLKPKTGA